MANADNTAEKEEGVKVVWKGDREACVGEDGLHLDLGEDNILYITSAGEIDGKEASVIREVILKFINIVEGGINLLIDLNKAGKQTPETRNIWKEFSEAEERIRKIALFGLHPVARILASFVIGVTKKKDMRFFKTKEEALAWLEEK